MMSSSTYYACMSILLWCLLIFLLLPSLWTVISDFIRLQYFLHREHSIFAASCRYLWGEDDDPSSIIVERKGAEAVQRDDSIVVRDKDKYIAMLVSSGSREEKQKIAEKVAAVSTLFGKIRHISSRDLDEIPIMSFSLAIMGALLSPLLIFTQYVMFLFMGCVLGTSTNSSSMKLLTVFGVVTRGGGRAHHNVPNFDFEEAKKQAEASGPQAHSDFRVAHAHAECLVRIGNSYSGFPIWRYFLLIPSFGIVFAVVVAGSLSVWILKVVRGGCFEGDCHTHTLFAGLFYLLPGLMVAILALLLVLTCLCTSEKRCAESIQRWELVSAEFERRRIQGWTEVDDDEMGGVVDVPCPKSDQIVTKTQAMDEKKTD